MPDISGWLVMGASWRRFQIPIAYIIPFTPSSACIFLSPRFTARHTYMNMEAVKGFLAPLGLNTSSIQDTLVCILCSFPAPGQGLQLNLTETGCYWWNSRDCPKGFDIRMEWICRLFVLPFQAIWMAEAWSLAFYLTAHFSQEDYPYDWRVRFIAPCVYALMSLP